MAAPTHLTVGEWLVRGTAESSLGGARRQDADALAQLAESTDQQLAGLATPVRLTKGLVAQFGQCETAALLPAHDADERPSEALLFGRCVDYLVAHQIMVGRVDGAFDTVASMADAAGDDLAGELADLGEALPGFVERLDDVALVIDIDWGRVPASTWPRLQSAVHVATPAGLLTLAGRIDVEFGMAAWGHDTACIEVKSGAFRDEHRWESYWYAALVALRDEVVPRSAVWAPGRFVPFVVDVSTVEAVLRRLIAVARRLDEIARGDESGRTSGFWCDWCPLVSTCPEAATRVRLADGGRSAGEGVRSAASSDGQRGQR